MRASAQPDDHVIRVLVVENDSGLRHLLSKALGAQGWEVCTAATVAEAICTAQVFTIDAAVVDRQLPDDDGIGVLRPLRSQSCCLPVIFLSARDTVTDRVAALTAGGDDYLPKPCDVDELIARLRALMRRTNPKPGLGALLLVGDLSLDEQSGDVTRGGRQIRLTVTEFRVLRYLMLNARRVLSKAQIHDNVWPDDNHPWGRYNNVELYISYLRRKIDRGQPKMLHTVRGFGYVLRPPR